MPTDLQRSGKFSQTLTFDENGNLAPVTIYNPFAVSADGERQPFANNIIPAIMIDQVAKKFLAYFPEPNVHGDAGTNYNNYRKNVQSSTSQYQLDTRGDHQFNDNNRLGVRYSRLHDSIPLGNICRRFVPLQDRCAQRRGGLQLDHQPHAPVHWPPRPGLRRSPRASPVIPI